MVDNIDRLDQANAIVHRNTYWAMGAGVLPLPFLDIVTIAGVQLKVIRELSSIYNQPFREDIAKKAITSLIASIGSVGLGTVIGSSLLKFVPVVGQSLGIVSVPVISGMITHAVGRTFVAHLEKGGTVLDFNTKSMRKYFRQEYKNAKKSVTAIKRKNKVTQIFSSSRQQQLQVMSSGDEIPGLSKAEKKANLEIAIASTSFGLAIGGALVYWPMTLLSIPGSMFINMKIYKRAYAELKRRHFGVEALSSIFMTLCVLGLYMIPYTLLTLSYALSHRLLLKVQGDSEDKLLNVFKQQPRFVWVLVDGAEVQTPFEEVKVGDLATVNAGEVIPIDGTITKGMGSIDQQILTGEFQPAEKGIGEQVFASTVVLSGKIYIQVEKTGEDTVVANIGQILNNTSNFKNVTLLRAETIAEKTVWPTLILGGLALPFTGPASAIAVLNSHFKYRLRVVAPISTLSFLNLMSREQILIKDGRTLDRLNKVDTIVFDKTGTLTQEQPHIGKIYLCDDYDENELLGLAAAAEYRQAHPIAKAIVEAAGERKITIPQIDDAEYKVGYGIAVTIGKLHVKVGSHRFMEISDLVIPHDITEKQSQSHEQGHSLIMVAVDNKLIGAIELLPTIRPEVKEVLSQLRQNPNIKSMYIISGDHEIPTRQLAKELGIENYFAGTLPEDKANIIKRLQTEGRSVCYIGDGINDSIALKSSQVSVSLRGASTVATDTAQIILMDKTLRQLPHLFELAAQFESNMNRNLMFLLVPMCVGMTGALFFHFGVIQTVLLGHSGLLAGILNSMLPALKNETEPAKLAAPQTDNDLGQPAVLSKIIDLSSDAKGARVVEH